jgi:hypothetical protein
MLPDLVSLLGLRMPRVLRREVQEGVGLHYRTDVVFHRAPAFLRLLAGAHARLVEMGLRRGSARAAAHVGTEILLDIELAKSTDVTARALEAFDAAAREAGEWLRWPSIAVEEKFRIFVSSMADRDLAGRHATPEQIAWRVARTLTGRRLLELDAQSEERVAAWLAEAEPMVQLTARELLGEVADGLRQWPTRTGQLGLVGS